MERKIELKDVSIDDKNTFYEYYAKYPVMHCDYNFSNLIFYGDIYRYQWFTFEDHLVIYNPVKDLIFMPVGEPYNLDFLKEISDIFKSSDKSGNFCFCSNDFIAANPDLSFYFDVIEDRSCANYIYKTDKLANLAGRDLHGKRNLISQFIKNYPENETFETEKIKMDCENFRSCVELAKKWLNNKGEVDETMQIELHILEKICKYVKDLDLGLVVLKVKAQIVAFSIFSRQTKEMATVHFEKFDVDYAGASQMINKKTAMFLLNKYKYINREDDLGLESLRRSKLSYKPDILLTVNLLKRK